eukprot:TRINITY_DN310_c0_g1_i1.p1 TRINITY_DN310_c0_g1~~TRINITY_DN310_c0_g1_i1.p1  ORF type:complete len:531 (-),score=21.20 TRINITY_DN310_c0_g1_i1:609-2201(-)
MTTMYPLNNPYIPRYQPSPVSFHTSMPLPSVEEMKEDLKKQKGKRQSRPGTTARDIKDKKKRRLEQNRLSARESRKKKKAYIETLENEVQKLQAEIQEYKIRLAENMTARKVQSVSYNDTVVRMKAEIQQMVEKIILACKLEDVPAAEAAFQSLLIRYGVQSEERRKVIETLSKGVIECMVPMSYMYILWAAQNKSGVFNPENYQPEEFRKDPSDELDKIGNYVKLNEFEQMIIFKAKDKLESALEELKTKVRKFVDSKNELYEEAKRLDNFINESITSKLNSNVAGEFFNWMQITRGRTEFTEHTLFGLTKEDFGGFDLNYPIYPETVTFIKGNFRKMLTSKQIEERRVDKVRQKRYQESPEEEVRQFKRPNIFEQSQKRCITVNQTMLPLNEPYCSIKNSIDNILHNNNKKDTQQQIKHYKLPIFPQMKKPSSSPEEFPTLWQYFHNIEQEVYIILIPSNLLIIIRQNWIYSIRFYINKNPLCKRIRKIYWVYYKGHREKWIFVQRFPHRPARTINSGSIQKSNNSNQ